MLRMYFHVVRWNRNLFIKWAPNRAIEKNWSSITDIKEEYNKNIIFIILFGRKNSKGLNIFHGIHQKEFFLKWSEIWNKYLFFT